MAFTQWRQLNTNYDPERGSCWSLLVTIILLQYRGIRFTILISQL